MATEAVRLLITSLLEQRRIDHCSSVFITGTEMPQLT